MKHLRSLAVSLALIPAVLTACKSAAASEEEAREGVRPEASEVQLGAWYDVYLESVHARPAGYAPVAASTYGARVPRPGISATGFSTRIYDVSDLLAGVADYRAPNVGDLRRNEDQPGYGEAPVVERVALTNEDALIDLIRDSIAPGTWDDPGVSLRVVNGKLIVRHRQ